MVHCSNHMVVNMLASDGQRVEVFIPLSEGDVGEIITVLGEKSTVRLTVLQI